MHNVQRSYENRFMKPSDTDHRLDTLEARAEFQDATISALNDVVVQLQARLTRAEKAHDLLVEKYRELRYAGDRHTTDEPEPPPPHY